MCRDALGMPMACRGTLGVMWRARRHDATDCATVYLLGNSFFTWHGPGPALLLPRDEPSSVACRTACRTVSFVVGEQFLGVSSCFVQCFVHNKHPRDRPPQQISHSNRPKLDYFDSAILSSTCYLKRCGNTGSKTLIFAAGRGKTVYMSAITRILCGSRREAKVTIRLSKFTRPG